MHYYKKKLGSYKSLLVNLYLIYRSISNWE